MDGFDLLAKNEPGRVQVDVMLDRFFSLAKNPDFAVGSHRILLVR
ncbi:MAG TPA: hypothetical protein VGI56_06930 [Galbitalea sp.]|jgi:hypothetical protein